MDSRVSFQILPATRDDAPAIAALHTESWRSAYADFVPHEFLDGPIVEERSSFWAERMATEDDARTVLKAMEGSMMVGFVCVLRDADPDWGPLLDNLHVRPAWKRQGIGCALLAEARKWAANVAPGRPMHLWVVEDNAGARRFYDRQGGIAAERQVVELTAGIMTPALRYVWQPLG